MKPDNKIHAGLDRKILSEVCDLLTPAQVREWFIKIKMSEHGRNFTDIAKRHRLSTWYLCGSVSGRYPLLGRVQRALEAELSIDLGPFIGAREKKRYV